MRCWISTTENKILWRDLKYNFAETEEKHKHATMREVERTYTGELQRFKEEEECVCTKVMLPTANIWKKI